MEQPFRNMYLLNPVMVAHLEVTDVTVITVTSPLHVFVTSIVVGKSVGSLRSQKIV